MMKPNQVAELIVKTLADKKGKDIKLLNTEKLTVLSDYFIICTGTSVPHIKTLSEEVDKILSDAGEPPLRREGYRSGSWVLLDFGCAVVHIFSEEMREFYALERLWADAPEIDIATVI